MLKIKPPDYKFCPFCGGKLQVKPEELKKRKYCSVCNWIYYPHVAGSAAAVIVQKGKTLMVKRKREPYKNTWTFPAGFVDFGEHPRETLAREVAEETGLRIKKAELFEIRQSIDDPRSPGHFLFFYRVEVFEGRLKADKDENADVEWKEIKKTPKIGWQSHQDIFRLLKNKKLQEPLVLK